MSCHFVTNFSLESWILEIPSFHLCHSECAIVCLKNKTPCKSQPVPNRCESQDLATFASELLKRLSQPEEKNVVMELVNATKSDFTCRFFWLITINIRTKCILHTLWARKAQCTMNMVCAILGDVSLFWWAIWSPNGRSISSRTTWSN